METIHKTYSTSRFIKVKWDYVDFHKWDDAPDEVAFLKNLHRHKFYATAMIEVLHDDRELEFFMVLRRIEQQIMPFMFVDMRRIKDGMKVISSCEQQAEFILNGLKAIYGEDRTYSVEISEDNENSAVVQWCCNE